MALSPGDVTAVVVSYQVADLTLACIDSVRSQGVGRIVVVDNASTDGTVEAVRRAAPDVDVVALYTNLGYGGAADQGAAGADTELIAVLNPDLTLEAGAIAALASALDADPTLALVGPRIETPDGRLYPSARTFPSLVDSIGHGFLRFAWPTNPFTRRYEMDAWDHDTAGRVDWVAGTAMVVRRSDWEALGGFDPGYFMYLEDVDLCWRLARAGRGVGYVPTARVVHAVGKSTDKAPYRMIAAHHRSLLRFATRTMEGPSRLLLPVVALGVGVRLLLAWADRARRGVPHAAR